MKKPRYRVFDYPARFYKPEEDEKERKKRRLGFSRQRKVHSKKRNPLIWLVILILIVYIYLKLSGMS